jgi:hypothetical protein
MLYFIIKLHNSWNNDIRVLCHLSGIIWARNRTQEINIGLRDISPTVTRPLRVDLGFSYYKDLCINEEHSDRYVISVDRSVPCCLSGTNVGPIGTFNLTILTMYNK